MTSAMLRLLGVAAVLFTLVAPHAARAEDPALVILNAGVYDRVLAEVERPLISICLAATKGNQIRAAQLLGLNRNTLRKKIKDLGLEVIKGLRSE